MSVGETKNLEAETITEAASKMQLYLFPQFLSRIKKERKNSLRQTITFSMNYLSLSDKLSIAFLQTVNGICFNELVV